MQIKKNVIVNSWTVNFTRTFSMISLEMAAKLKSFIISHEGKRNYPYVDTVGKVTIGIGYNLTDRGLSDTWIDDQYEKDVTYFNAQLLHDFPWYESLCDARKMVLIDMAFMGYKSLKGFVRLFEALSEGEYEIASQEVLNSLWAQQVGHRAVEDAEIMRTGELCSL
jgi:lysozyme